MLFALNVWLYLQPLAFKP